MDSLVADKKRLYVWLEVGPTGIIPNSTGEQRHFCFRRQQLQTLFLAMEMMFVIWSVHSQSSLRCHRLFECTSHLHPIGQYVDGCVPCMRQFLHDWIYKCLFRPSVELGIMGLNR